MEHHATILWRRTSESFTYDSYNRAHEWRFADLTVPASAAPDFRGDAAMVNPEVLPCRDCSIRFTGIFSRSLPFTLEMAPVTTLFF